MKFVLLITVFCVVPCAFQDVWDDYDTWYDDLNGLEDGALAENLDLPKDDLVIEPESVENDENKDFHAADYGSDDNYRDYEIEDNRDEVKNKLEKEQEPNQDFEQDDDNFESAVQDFDAFQQIINNDKLSEDVIDKILEVDEKSQMDLSDLLPEEIPQSDNENLDAIPEIALDKELVDEGAGDVFKENNEFKEVGMEQNEDNVEKGGKDDQSDIGDIRNETQQLLEKLDSVFDEDASDDIKDVPDAQPNLQDIVDETRQILEDTNTNFDENKDIKEEEETADLPDAEIEDEMKDIMDETQQILEKMNGDFDENKDTKEEEKTADLSDAQIDDEMKDIIDETQQILEKTNGDFDENKDTKAEEETADLSDAEIGDEMKDIMDAKEGEETADLSDAEIEDELKDIMDETQQILEKTNGDFNENKDTKEEEEETADLSDAEIEDKMKDTIDETRQILEETNNDFDENKNEEQNLEEPIQYVPVFEVEENADAEDSVDKLYEDLNEDLDKLFDTWKKLSLENNDEVDESAKNAEDDKVEVNADDDFNRDYANIDVDAKDKIDFDYEGEARILAMRNDYYESILDKDLSDLFKDFENDDDGDERSVSVENNADINDKESAPILYGNDALAAESNENNEKENAKINFQQPHVEENEDNMKISSEKSENEVDKPEQIEEKTSAEEIKATKDVDELTSSELDELSQQFVMLHDSEIKMTGDDTPIHITLTADEPVVITSPNYPNSYPTDQTVVDWILEGLGTGIEVNITDLAINSAQGHFLMLKPGQSDASGDSGIVFAYRINSERRYRFRDVNRMFVRFNPLGGMSFSRGFQLSARMIEPPAGESGEDIPEPEFLVPEPQHTATLLLAGVNSTGFLELKDEFQRLLADMATMYINANDIDPGMNSTAVVTQITRSYVCNINWPGFDSCVEVTFGVPLIYEDEDVPSRLKETELMEMWDTYASRDPFAARLSQMGISDYTVPGEAKILTVWVVIGVSVVIAAAMLAFVLWRYSCIDNYTRMQEFSDTDSIMEKKRGLDMYPTPHQTLPPLYSENDYKWADRSFDDSTRVDMGGFANNTFVRDELSSDSEDDVVVSRDRNSFQPREFNDV